MNQRIAPWLMGMIGLVAVVVGVFAADGLLDDATTALPEPERVHSAPLPGGGADGASGALYGEVTLPGTTPLFEDAVPVYPTEFDDEGVPQVDDPAAGPGQPGSAADPAAGATTTLPGQPPPAAAPEDGPVIRFLDVCTINAAGCPAGVAATVLYAANTGPPPPIDFAVIPEGTRTLFPSLRCDPGVPSQTAIPLVLLSNRPFDLLHVRLRAADGTLLDEVVNTSSDPSEFPLFDDRFRAGEPLAATLAEGAHTCLTLHTDRRVSDAPDRTGGFELFVQGYADQSYQAKTVPFTGQYDADRPPVRILPLDANRAYLIVPQLPDDTSVVWVHGRYEGAPGCEGTPPPLDTRSTRRTPAAPPHAFSPAGLAAPDYPWDRAYSHYTLWDLDLVAGAQYTLCVRWVGEGRVDEWHIETPDGVELYVAAGPLRHTRTAIAGTLLVRMFGVSGCYIANPHGQSDLWPKFPDVDLFGDGTYLNTYPDMCHSEGRWLGQKVQIQALFPDGTNDVYGMVEIPTQVLIDRCTDVGLGEEGPCTTHLEWRNRNVLCGGGFGTPSCQGDLFFSLEVRFRVTRRTANHRPDPRDWGVFRIARLAPGDGDLSPPETVPLP